MSYYSEVEGILSWVERGCRRLMSAGGGPLEQERTGPRAWSPRTKLTDEQKARAIELAKTGQYFTKQIAEMVGGKPTTIAKLLDRSRAKAPDQRARWREEHRCAALTLAHAGECLAHIANTFGVNEHTVRKFLATHGIKARDGRKRA
jgi:transposase-like protein